MDSKDEEMICRSSSGGIAPQTKLISGDCGFDETAVDAGKWSEDRTLAAGETVRS
jgi:hypothetical protein